MVESAKYTYIWYNYSFAHLLNEINTHGIAYSRDFNKLEWNISNDKKK